jgi:hypothetical protein
MNTGRTLTAIVSFAFISSLFVFIDSSAQTSRRVRPAAQRSQSLRLQKLPHRKPKNILFILTDDQRYDALGFLHKQSFFKTPSLDALASGGVYLPNAFVTTALCAPSRASILTGMYAHRHRVVDNDSAVPRGLIYFPQYLQRAGYETAFIGSPASITGSASSDKARTCQVRTGSTLTASLFRNRITLRTS